LLLLSSAGAATSAPSSVLGLEPGDLRLCNDELGVILWGPDSAPTLSVGKSDVWDRRNPQPAEPVLTLAQITAMAQAGDRKILNGAAYYTAYNSHDFPCPKPVGQLILRLPFLGSNGTLTVTHEPHALRFSASNQAKSLQLRLFVSAVRNLIVISGLGAGLEEGDLAVRLYRHRDTIIPGGVLHPTLGDKTSSRDFDQLPMPRAGATNSTLWIAQDFGKDPTFPDGFQSVLAARVVGAPMLPEVVEGQTGLGTPLVAPKEGRLSHGLTKRFTPINSAQGSAATGRLGKFTERLQLFATVVTSQDAPDPLPQAQRLLAEAIRQGEDALWAEHEQQLARYEANPHARAWSADKSLNIDVPWGGLPYRPRPFGYYGDVAICSVDSTKFCFQDSSMWHADFHFNEVGATSLCLQRQFDALDSYFVMIRALLPMAQANARQVYGCAGAVYPLVHYPLKADTIIHTHITWEQSMEITAMLAKPFWQRFLYTWDVDFLRQQAYPILREGARFYAEFLKPGNDGVCHVFPTVSPEHRGITRNLEFNKDSQSGITLIRYHLKAAAQAAELLALDETERNRWRELARHLPPYPTVETPEGPIFIDVAGAKPIEYNIAVPLSAVFWGDDIGLDSPPEQIELARRTLRLINVWEPHRGYLVTCRRRLGIYNPADGLSLENVLQSHTGIIHVFPVVPEGFAGGFENLGAQGAFVVAGERLKDAVRSVTLTSLAGNPCALANPWPGAQVQVVDLATAQPIPATLDKRIIRFPTNPNRRYKITHQS
jgi:hypothetical protein